MSDFMNYQSNLEGMPQTQMMMFVTAPPPPPPPPAPAPAPVQAVAPPPPPPAEPMPVFTSAGTLPIYGQPPSSSGLFTMSQERPPLPPGFDASRPPPPVVPSSIKRPMDPISAGPSKIRKEDSSKLPDAPCENCVQRELRIDFYKQQMFKLHCDDEYQTLVYKKKLEEYEHGREILRALVGPELFRFLDEYIEGTPQVQDILAQFHQSSFLPGTTSTVPRQLLLQLMEYVARSEVETAPVRLDETTLLQTLLRRSGSIGRTPSPEHLHTVSVLEMLRNTTTHIDSLSESGSDVARANQNGFRYTNGQKESGSGSSTSGGSRYPPTTSTATRSYARGGGAPGGYAAPAAGPAAPPPPPPAAPYPPFFPTGPPQPPQPPAARPYYSQPYGPTINPPFPNVGYSSRMSAPGSSQMSMRPPSSVAPSYNEYMMARYPHPPQYYPQFQ